ncbi:MAG: ribosome-associated translation inhibitor RaiA [Patescibacteria group bacterium]
MQIKINGKGIELTDAINDYVEKKIGGLNKFYDKIIRASVTVGVENRHHQKGQIFIAECKLEVPGKDLFASKNEKTLYKAIDKIRDYLESELKKHKTKSREKDKRKVRSNKEYTVELV